MTAPRFLFSVVFNVLIDETVILLLKAVPPISADLYVMELENFFNVIDAEPQRIVSKADISVFLVVDHLIHSIESVDI